jgi:hypothetical protein
MHLGIIELHPLHSPSFVRVCFTPKHMVCHLHGPLDFTFNYEPNVKVVTLMIFDWIVHYIRIWWTLWKLITTSIILVRGDLRNFIHFVKWPLEWFPQIVHYVAHYKRNEKLHARGWFHRDLKALNILAGKGRSMVTNEDNKALAEMISPYLFLSIMMGNMRTLWMPWKCWKPWKKTPDIHTQLHSTLSWDTHSTHCLWTHDLVCFGSFGRSELSIF